MTDERDDVEREHGHRFEIVFRSAGSYGLSTEAHPEPHDFVDADWWSEPSQLVIRAWSLRSALAAAASQPLTAWDGLMVDDPPTFVHCPIDGDRIPVTLTFPMTEHGPVLNLDAPKLVEHMKRHEGKPLPPFPGKQ